MYLLNHTLDPQDLNFELVFTFHYVSIKSRTRNIALGIWEVFTFHYVSIKSVQQGNDIGLIRTFTFHYVSIKSRLRQRM